MYLFFILLHAAMFQIGRANLASLNNTGLVPSEDETNQLHNINGFPSLFPVAVVDPPLQSITKYSHFSLAMPRAHRNGWLNFTLEPSLDVISSTAHMTLVRSDGIVESTRTIGGSNTGVFKGTVWANETDNIWRRAGWARVSLLNDAVDTVFDGAYSFQGRTHKFRLRVRRTVSTQAPEPTLVAFEGRNRHSDISALGPKCRLASFQQPDLDAEKDPSQTLDHAVCPGTHATFDDKDYSNGTTSWRLGATAGGTTGCPSVNKIALVGVATDCSYVSLFDSVDDVVQNVISMVNSASRVFERSFNVTLRLNELEIREGRCPTSERRIRNWNMPCSDGSLFDRLHQFSIWRETKRDDNAFWTLLTGCRGAGIGLAWLGQLCMVDYDRYRGTGANIVAATTQAWQVFAYVLDLALCHVDTGPLILNKP